MPHPSRFLTALVVAVVSLSLATASAADKKADKKAAKTGEKKSVATPGGPEFPPKLNNGATSATDTSPTFLKRPESILPEVKVATTPPTIDFAFVPGQTYPGKPWSAWGESIAANGKYYFSIGDHLAPNGNGFVYEYDPATKKFRLLADLKQIMPVPEGHYSPGKVHSRLDLGSDGWIYFSTHRGSPSVTNDKYFYKGDNVLRCNPATGQAEIVAVAPVPKHCIPNGTLDPERLIFYGGTAPGAKEDTSGIQFFAYDVKNKKLLYSGPNGPGRSMIVAASTGKIYFTPGNALGPLMCFDPAKGGSPVEIPGEIGIRAATRETPQGKVYTVSTGQGAKSSLYAFDTKTEKIETLGYAAVGPVTYITALAAEPTGRYFYYVPGAHGGSQFDGAPVVQYDTKLKQKKVIAFLEPFYTEKYGVTPKGTYSVAIDPAGDKLYITWNISRDTRAWDSTAVTTIHIPASEREL